MGVAHSQHDGLPRNADRHRAGCERVPLLRSDSLLTQTFPQREVPVVGFVGDFLVFGVIDEVDRRELPSPTASTSASPFTPTKKATGSKTSTTPVKDDQVKLERFFSPVSSPSKKGKEKAANQEEAEPKHVDTRRWGFYISDSKTRYNPSMPPKNESRASRLQLMLYHRLLSSLLTPTPSADPSDVSPSPQPDCPAPFDWPRLYTHLSLDPAAPFTEPFLTSIQPVVVGSSLESSLSSARTLEQFVVALQRYGETLGAKLSVRGPFEPELEIHYRLRNSQRKWKAKKKSRKEREEEDLKRAIAESLSASEGGRNVATAGEDEEDLARALAMSLEQSKLEPTVVEEIVKLEAHNPVDLRQDSAMEELDAVAEAVPFIADVSLLVPPRDGKALVPTPPASPPPGADVASLPSNSQAAPPLAPPADSRYNLRRRRHTTISSSEIVNPAIPPLISPSTPPSKRLRPAPPPLTPATAPPRAESPTPPPSPPEELLEGTIIGTERFKKDPAELSAWLGDVTSLWKGEREPRGVSLEQTSRCRCVPRVGEGGDLS